MSFPRYPKYKDSGVQWLGEVPEHWETSLAKRFITVQSGEMISSSEETEEGFPIVGGNGVRGYTGKMNTTCDALVIGRVGARCGCVHHIRQDFWASEHAFRVIEKQALARRFFFYLLTAIDLNKFAIKTAQPLLNTEIVETQWISVPPLPEQSAIATFLDRETSKIDALIAEQRRLIELLQEKRQAVISHAVTKGLNPDAPMKDSGIEWLGEVPEHWAVLPLKRIVSSPITDGPHETPAFLDEGVSFVSAEAVSAGRIDFAKVRGCISAEDNARYSLKYAPQQHDIYMVKSGATTGVTAIVEDRTDFNIWSPLAAIRCGQTAAPYFVLNFMRSRNFQEAVTLNWSYGTQQNIGMGVIENLPCVLPPRAEQHAIVAHLNRFDGAATPLVNDAE